MTVSGYGGRMTPFWQTLRKVTRWANVVLAVVAVPLILTRHDLGWTLMFVAFCGSLSWWEPKGEWAPYQFPTRKERKAAQSELMPK